MARAHDLIVISDEVWEHLLIDGQDFVPLASLAGMAERTIKCGSAGKIFSLTGWKIGWIAAAPELATLAARAHQFLTFASAPNLQAAVAFGLAEGDAWLAPMRERFARARDRMNGGLEAAGFAVLPSAATYFLIVDLAASGIALDDEAFAKLAVEQAGVAVVPLSPFADDDRAAPPGPAVLRQARRDDRCRGRGAGAGARRWRVRRRWRPAARRSASAAPIRRASAAARRVRAGGRGDSPARRRSPAAQHRQLVLGLDPFGGAGQAEAVGEVDHALTISALSAEVAASVMKKRSILSSVKGSWRNCIRVE